MEQDLIFGGLVFIDRRQVRLQTRTEGYLRNHLQVNIGVCKTSGHHRDRMPCLPNCLDLTNVSGSIPLILHRLKKILTSFPTFLVFTIPIFGR